MGGRSGGWLADGVTVFLTTQYLEEADRLADRIAVLDGGRIVAEGTAAELKQRVAGPRLDLTMAGPDAFRTSLAALGERAVHGPGRLTLGVPPTAAPPTSARCSTSSTRAGDAVAASPCTTPRSTTSSSP